MISFDVENHRASMPEKSGMERFKTNDRLKK